MLKKVVRNYLKPLTILYSLLIAVSGAGVPHLEVSSQTYPVDINPQHPTTPHRILVVVNTETDSSSTTYSLPVFSGDPLDSPITRLVKKTASPLSYLAPPNTQSYDFSSPGETGDLYSQLELPKQMIVYHIIEVQYWMQSSDSVDIKIYRTYSEEVEDFTLTQPADYATKTPKFEECNKIIFNSTIKQIERTSGCPQYFTMIDYDPTASNYDILVRDLIILNRSSKTSKIDYLKPPSDYLKAWTNNYSNIDDTFTKNGYKLSLGRWFFANWKSQYKHSPNPKTSIKILKFAHNEEESFTDRTYEISFSLSSSTSYINQNMFPNDYMMKMKFKFSWVEGGFITVKYSRSQLGIDGSTLTDYSEEFVATTQLKNNLVIMIKFTGINFAENKSYSKILFSTGKLMKPTIISEIQIVPYTLEDSDSLAAQKEYFYKREIFRHPGVANHLSGQNHFLGEITDINFPNNEPVISDLYVLKVFSILGGLTLKMLNDIPLISSIYTLADLPAPGYNNCRLFDPITGGCLYCPTVNRYYLNGKCEHCNINEGCQIGGSDMNGYEYCSICVEEYYQDKNMDDYRCVKKTNNCPVDEGFQAIMDSTNSRIEYCNSCSGNKKTCPVTSCLNEEFRNNNCSCKTTGCSLCISKQCQICNQFWSYYVSVTAGVRTISCSQNNNCNRVGEYVHENTDLNKPLHCASGACDIGFKLDAAKTKCVLCPQESQGSCRDGEPVLEISGPNQIYGYQNSAPGGDYDFDIIIQTVPESEGYYGCSKLNRENQCLECLSGFGLTLVNVIDKRCRCFRGSYYDLVISSCQTCPTGSKFFIWSNTIVRACESASEPIECESPLSLIDTGSGKICGCPSGKYIDRSIYPPQCVNCLSSCAQCDHQRCYKCSSSSNSVLLDGFSAGSEQSCGTCPDTHYIEYDSGNSTRVCRECLSLNNAIFEKKTIGGVEKCTCKTSYEVFKLVGNEHVCQTCGGLIADKNGYQCVPSCSTGERLDTRVSDGAKQCQKCPENCDTCNSNASECQTCSSGYFLNVETKQCSLDCSEDFYYKHEDGSTKECRRCNDSTCLKCTESLTPSLQTCLQCPPGQIIQTDGFGCSVNCPLFFYKNGATCSQCQVPDCTSCLSGSLTCNSCDNPIAPSISKILSEDKTSCLDSCPENKILLGSPSHCSTCSSIYPSCFSCNNTSCLKCKTGFMISPTDGSCQKNLELKFSLKQSASCMYESDYCIDIILQSNSSILSLEEFIKKDSDFSKSLNLTSIFSLSDEYLNKFEIIDIILDRSKNTIILLDSKTNDNIDKVSINSKNQFLGTRASDDILYNLSKMESEISLSASSLSKGAKKVFNRITTAASEGLKATSKVAPYIMLLTAFTNIDNSGTLISFTQTIKYMTTLRFIEIESGEIFGQFLDNMDKGLEPTSTFPQDIITQNKKSTFGKLDKSKYPLTSIDTILDYILPYIIFFFLNKLIQYLINIDDKNSKISPFLFYFSLTINKLHFVFFNMYIISGILINTRSILHTTTWSNDNNIKLDKLINYIAFFLYWVDIIELIKGCFDKEIYKSMAEAFQKNNKVKISKNMELEEVENIKGKNKKNIQEIFWNYSLLQSKLNSQKSINLNKNIKILDQNLQELPVEIPGKLLNKKDAKKLGYVEIVNCENAIAHLKQKVEIGNFIYANLKLKDSIYSLTSAKLNSVMSRIRIIFYQVIIVSMIRLPILVCMSIMSLEVVFLYFYVWVGFRHQYPREWLIYISTLNTSFLNMLILLNMMFCIIVGTPAPLFVQSMLIVVIVIIIVLELILLVLRILSQIFGFIYLMYKRVNGKKLNDKSRKMFIRTWVRGERLNQYLSESQVKGRRKNKNRSLKKHEMTEKISLDKVNAKNPSTVLKKLNFQKAKKQLR